MSESERHPLFSGITSTSLGTLASRVLGVVRESAAAGLLGLSKDGIMDAYVVAFRIPNLFRRLFGEGAMTASDSPSSRPSWMRSSSGLATCEHGRRLARCGARSLDPRCGRDLRTALACLRRLAGHDAFAWPDRDDAAVHRVHLPGGACRRDAAITGRIPVARPRSLGAEYLLACRSLVHRTENYARSARASVCHGRLRAGRRRAATARAIPCAEAPRLPIGLQLCGEPAIARANFASRWHRRRSASP